MCGLPPTIHTHTHTHRNAHTQRRKTGAVLPQEGALGHHSGLCGPAAFVGVPEEPRGERRRKEGGGATDVIRQRGRKGISQEVVCLPFFFF